MNGRDEIKAVYEHLGLELPDWLKYDAGQKRDKQGRWSAGGIVGRIAERLGRKPKSEPKKKRKITKPKSKPEKSKDESGVALPKDLRKMTKSQRNSVMKFLTSQPLPRLRGRQDLLVSQLVMAVKRKNEQAITNIQIRQDMLVEAVDRIAFPEDWK